MIRIHNRRFSEKKKTFSLALNENIFEEAREYFETEGQAVCDGISVLDDKGRYLFSLELQDDILYYVNRRGTTYQLDRIREEKYIDYKLFDGIGAVVFYELEEYTYQICRILQKKYPDMTFVRSEERRVGK